MGINESFWRDKKVLITGHTGFKGSWLALWLQQMKAHVYGFALAPPTQPNLFEKANVGQCIASHIGDIRDLSALKSVFLKTEPDIVIHLAAQPLVRYAYQNPVETYQTNVIGTLHVLEAIRACPSVRAAVIVTTDKCYDNKEWIWAYRENEPLGGYDPYSSSKACAELLIASYRNSFFSDAHSPAIASARAGNVIGGGDWSPDRLVPDIIQAFQANQTLSIRNPNAIRPWQHVLDSLSGYLLLAEKLFTEGQHYAEPWNFGPDMNDMQPVQSIVQHLATYWPQANWTIEEQTQFHEARSLKLDSTKAHERLDWHPRWRLSDALQLTAEWYQAESQGLDMGLFCRKQIQLFTNQRGAG
ncbi:CDP-glucose 4,6-dehydratase [Methylotuvimicrobium buryatense]|uniref:CDP-glucose 4,6-dehydratase n=1 Tax=Methylotuvimicrobium buryatense TaxID=95641 RepID=A0A4P9UTG9_METBY|nr:CDP-glucose 4,6-dehydratase [Methylotuvimicrobium buryatense]QCW83883.1 CDP-glucose 4,6-dehydratase [Methylotuvimicrobium buryatense]